MKVAVFTYHNANTHEGASFADVGNLTLPSKRAYAARHGYDFLFRDDFDYTKTPLGFERVEMVLEHQSSYDWMFYTDADAMIMNPDIRIEDLVDDAYDLIVSHNYHVGSHVEVNNGVMLVKNTEWSHTFFRWMHQPVYHAHNWLSQKAIMDAFALGQGAVHIKLTPFRFFNSFWHSAFPKDNWQPGDFVLHAAGGGNAWRKRLFTELAPQVAAGGPITIKTEQAP